jgi:Tat protein secretion system quality control protein TatD with DNase activity
MADQLEHDETVNLPGAVVIFDAHCHPTDTMASIDDISNMRAKALTIMATRREDQGLVADVAARFPLHHKDEYDKTSSTLVVPAFGWHPWFSHQIVDDRATKERPNAVTHYKNVLTPNVDDQTFLQALPETKSLVEFLTETEGWLKSHPFALVGEVGVDRSFRLPKEWLPNQVASRDPSRTPGSREGRTLSPYKVQLAHQKVILEAQLQLAGKLRRPVSIHSVQAHGAVFEVLHELWKGYKRPSNRQRKRRASAAGAHAVDGEGSNESEEPPEALPFPPRVCMHSYSGPADFVRQFIQNTVPIDVYFSFSEVINFSERSSEKVAEAIKAVPDSRILIESDLHRAGEDMDNCLASVFRRVCNIKKWSPEEGSKTLSENWRNFIFGS